MAKAFNLTAQINLRGPANIKPVVAKIKRELGTISTNLDIKFDSKVAKNVQNLTGRLTSLNAVLAETNRNSKDLAITLSSLSTAFSALGSASKTVSGINTATKSVSSTAKATKQAASEMAEFGKQSALAIRRFAAFSVVTSGVFALTNAISAGIRAFVSFDQEIIKLRQTTGAGALGIKDLENQITSLAVSLGVSSEKLASVAIILAQAGLSARETKTALTALAKTELTPSFENLEKTTEGAIAALRQFDIEVEDLEKALGSINAVAAAFAVESGDIIAAIQRAGGAFAASSKGVSEGVGALNEFIAVFTSVRATTRESAETIATGLRTIFTRIQRGSTIEFLREFGVELTDAEGKFVGTFNAVQRLSEVLNTLDPRDLRFAQIVEELGGFRQIGKVIPLIQQFSEAQKALGVAQRGQGSLAESQATAQLSLANQLARVREEFLALVRAVGQSQTFQILFKSILGITSGLIKLASVFKPILPLLAILGGIKGFGALTQFGSGFIGGIRRGGGADVEDNIRSNVNGSTDQTRSEATERATTALSNNTDSLKALTSSVEALTQAINSKLGGAGGTTLNSGGKVLAFKRGGSVPGSGRGDKVKALLEPNEYVMNRKAVQNIGRDNLEKMNRGGTIIVDSARNRQLPEEKKIIDSYLTGAVNSLSSKFGGQNQTKSPDNITNYSSIIGNIFQSALELAGSGRLTKSDQRRPFDFPSGLQPGLGSLFPNLDGKAIPVDAKKSTRGDFQKNMLDKIDRFYAENSSYVGTSFGAAVYEPATLTSIPLDIDDSVSPWKAIRPEKKAFGGMIQKFMAGSPGGVRVPSGKGRGVKRPKGARAPEYDIPNTENFVEWAKGIYSEYDADPSLPTASFMGLSMPVEIAYANMLLGEFLKRGGAGLSTGKKFIVTPPDKIDDALMPYLVPNPNNPSQLGFFGDDKILAFQRANKTELELREDQKRIDELSKRKTTSQMQRELFGFALEGVAKSVRDKTLTPEQLETLSPEVLAELSRDPRSQVFSLPKLKAESAPVSSGLLDSIGGPLSEFRKSGGQTNLAGVIPEAAASQIKAAIPTYIQSLAGEAQKVAKARTAEKYFDSFIGGGTAEKPAHATAFTETINQILKSGLIQGFAGGGLVEAVRSFMAGGINRQLTIEEARGLSASTILPGLGGRDKAQEILEKYWSGVIPKDPKKPKSFGVKPTPQQVLDKTKIKEWNSKFEGSDFLKKILQAREALFQAYVDSVNQSRSGTSALSTQGIVQAQESGLLFGVAGMYGNAFPPRKLELRPGKTKNAAINKLKGPVDVSLVGGVLAKDEIEKQARLNAQTQQLSTDQLLDAKLSPTRDELSAKFGEKASLYAIRKANKDRAIQYVDAIAKSLDPSSGGSQIFLDFDKTLAFGADKLTRRGPDGKPDYSLFSDPNEVDKGLSTARLSQLGNRLKSLVQESNQAEPGLGSELLRRMFVVTARPDETTGLIAQWVESQGLPIPSSNFVGVGGPGKSPNDVAVAKAEQILSKLSGDKSIFIDDDLRNVNYARTRGLRALQYGANIDRKARKDAQDREGTSFEKFVRENLPPNLVAAMSSAQKGDSIDYPSGLGSTVAGWFDQPLLANIPTDIKRTVSGAGKIQSNIANYLSKNFEYAFGGKADGPSFDEVKQQIIDKYPEIEFRISKRKRGFGYNLMGARKSKGGLFGDDRLNFQQPTNLKQLVEVSDQLAQKLLDPQNAYFGGSIHKFAKGGSVPALLTPGEAVIDPATARSIGYAKLDKMNYADKNGVGKYSFGGGVSIVPGTGNTDSYGPVPLPVGSYVIRKKATEALGFNKGGSVGSIQKFAGGRRVGVIAEDRRLADLFKQLSSNIRGGMTSADAFDRVVESARTDFPEAANLLREAAEAFKSGADPKTIFAKFGGELARRAPDEFASGGLDSEIFDRLAGVVNSAADTMDLFVIEATDAASSLETFESSLKKRLQEQVLGREAQRRSSRIDLGRQIIRSRSTDTSDPAALAATLDEVRVPLTALIGTLKDADPTAIEDTLQAIVSGSAAGESLQELRDRLPLLNEAFNNTIDRTTALADIEAEAVSALGGLTASVRSTIEEIDALEYGKSGSARQEFGAAGEANPAGALRFKRSAIGGGLLRTAQSFQRDLGLGGVPVVGKALGGLNTVLSQLPGPIGNAVRAIGGLPGALAAAASIIGSEFIPQLNKLAGVAEDPFFAGIAGGVASGGSFAVSLGTIGQQIGGEIGGLVGTIGGAIVGVFKGFTDAFRQQQLNNALKGLTTATENAKIALDNLSKYDSAENARAVQKAINETEVSSRRLEEISQRTVGEQATDTGIYAGAGVVIAGILAAALAPVTGGLSVLATAGLLGTGAVAGGIYGATQGPSEMDDEALNSYLTSLATINDALSTLAARDIKFKSLEDLNSIINDFKDSAGNIDNAALGRQSEYIRQAQEGALRAAGYNIDSTANLENQLRSLGSGAQELANSTANIYAYQAGLEELNRQLGGNLTAVRQATDTEEERESITRRGFERIGLERRQLALQQRLALISKTLAVETENLADTYNKLLSFIQRYNDALNETDIAIANSTDILLNQNRLNKVSRADQQVLRNTRAYSQGELDEVLNRVSDLAGGGDRGTQLTDSIRGRKIVEEELPKLLRNVTQRNIGEVSGSITQLFENAGIGRDVTNALIEEIETVLESETGGRQGKSFDELLQQFPQLQSAMQSMEKANETAIALLEAQSNLYDKITDRLNAFGEALQKSTEWTLKAADIRVQSENDLAKALGKSVSLDSLNRVFNQQIELLTSDAARGFDGTTNPAEISNRIRQNQTAFETNEQQIREQPSTPQGRATVAALLKEQEKLKRSSANLYQALEKLATSGDNASNALSKLQDRRQISENATDLLERVFTQGAEEADRMFRSFGALQDALSGNLLFRNQQERGLAFEGYRTLAPLLSGQIANELRALLLENMLKGNNINLQDELIPGIGGQGRFTYEDILNNMRNPEADPTTKALIDSYRTATDVMIRAAEEISRLNSEAATKFSEAAASLINIPFPSLPDQANNGPMNQVAADVRTLTTNATQPGSIYTHDIKSEELLRSISQSLSRPSDGGPITGANNLSNINLPVFEKISTALPNLTTELLNTIKTLESFSVKISDLTEALQTFNGNNSNRTSTSARTTNNVDAFNVNIEAFSSATKEFGSYITRLERIKFPEKITMGGSYTLDVRVSGAAAFQSLEEKTRNIIDAEISSKLTELEEKIARSTGYSIDPRRREP